MAPGLAHLRANQCFQRRGIPLQCTLYLLPRSRESYPVPQLSWAELLWAASSEHLGNARPQPGKLRPLLPAWLAYTPGSTRLQPRISLQRFTQETRAVVAGSLLSTPPLPASLTKHSGSQGGPVQVPEKEGVLTFFLLLNAGEESTIPSQPLEVNYVVNLTVMVPEAGLK